MSPQNSIAATMLLCLLAPGARSDEATLRRDLERVFADWRTAMAARSVAAWREHTASHRQVSTRNLIVSRKQPFPKALFDFPLRAPEPGTLRFVKAESKGPTATAVYFGRVDMGIPDAGDIPENVLLLAFVQETGRWKFDTLRLVNLASAPDVRAALQSGGSSGYLNEPEFSPSGMVPATPKLCPAPDHVAALQVASLGYATSPQVNGFALPTVADAAEQHIIIGGLKDGENALALDIKPTPVAEGSARHLEVNAVVLTGNEDKPVIRVFNWRPPSGAAPAFAEQRIIVNKVTLRGN